MAIVKTIGKVKMSEIGQSAAKSFSIYANTMDAVQRLNGDGQQNFALLLEI